MLKGRGSPTHSPAVVVHTACRQWRSRASSGTAEAERGLAQRGAQNAMPWVPTNGRGLLAQRLQALPCSASADTSSRKSPKSTVPAPPQHAAPQGRAPLNCGCSTGVHWRQRTIPPARADLRPQLRAVLRPLAARAPPVHVHAAALDAAPPPRARASAASPPLLLPYCSGCHTMRKCSKKGRARLLFLRRVGNLKEGRTKQVRV
jgi:hypothetical protein